MLFTILPAAVLFAPLVKAHVAPFHPSMWCFNGISGDDINAEEAVNPLYQLPFSSYWMHANTGCLDHPPDDGQFLELPAGGSFTVEVASNRAMTSWSYGGANAGLWPDGQDHDDYDGDHTTCITVPNLHAENRSMAAGTAFAISYTSDISQVTQDNLVVFTVAAQTPWYRETTYDVPADMPACPDGGCICAWGWVPNHCGIPNMYMHPYRCKVTGATATTAIGTPQAAQWCEDNSADCVTGPKKFIVMNQNEGNTISLAGYQLNGQEKSAGYNEKLGFAAGAQNDIFTGSSSSSGSSSSGSSGSSSSGSSDSSSPSGSSSSFTGSPSSGDDSSSSSSSDSSSDSNSDASAPAATTSYADNTTSTTPSPTPTTSTTTTTSTPAATPSPVACRRRRRRDESGLMQRDDIPDRRSLLSHRRHAASSW
ncbi:hypothetical protein CPB85DRAFT_1434153 [Mucidula mucida]|nr:hypothetical protein CPB85DRAFT_1434153 [Mucidula mucida]